MRTGWPLVLGAFLGVMAGGSSTYFYSSGLFLKPMAQEFGWTRAEASLGPLVAILGYGVTAPLVGAAVDRLGAVRIGVLSLLALSAVFALLGLVTDGLGSFLLLMALLALLTCGSSPISFTRPLVEHFDRRRGLALGLAVTGIGVGAFLVPMSLGLVLKSHGWRAAYLVLAAAVLVAAPIVGLLLRGSGRGRVADTQPPARFGVLARPELWRLAVLFLLAALGVFGSIVHLVPMLSDRGMDPARAAGVASLLGAAVIGGRVFTGLMLDRWEASRLTAILLGASSIGLFMLATEAAPLVFPGAIFLGFAIGAESDLMAYLVSRRFTKAAYGVAFGGLYAAFSVGGAIGPLLAGYLRDLTGDYVLWQIISGMALLGAAGVALTLKRAPAVAA
jgi:predicted MFS family arabinose efflux permease